MRRLIRLFVALLLGTIPVVLGLVTALTFTGAGRDLLARTLTARLSEILRGDLKVGAIRGSFLHDLEFDSLVVRDTSGLLVASLPHVAVSYQLPNLVAGRIVLNRVVAERPTIQIIKHRNGRMNYQEVLRLGEGAPGGRSPLIEFRQLQMTGAAPRFVRTA